MVGVKALSRASALIAWLALACVVPNDVVAQQTEPTPKSGAPAAAKQAPKPAPPAPAPATKPQTPPQISIEQVLYLIRSTMLTLNDANRSGNYTVMRDLAAPSFQAKNSSADLAQAFADLRRRNFDLHAAALIAPQLTTAPMIDAGGKLILAGVFPTRPLQIKFDMVFEVSDGQWKLLGIAIATPEAPPLEAQTQQPNTPAAADPVAPAKRPTVSNPSPR
jgi:hypothetical protein